MKKDGGNIAINSMEELMEVLKSHRPMSWKDIPDIPLYMDQLVSLVERQNLSMYIGESLTPSMVHNYTKQEVVPKPVDKRYRQEHVAVLTMLSSLKQVLSIMEIRKLFARLSDIGLTIEEVYSIYLYNLDREMRLAREAISEKKGSRDILAFDNNENVKEKNVYILALISAISSFVRSFVTKGIIGMEEER